MRTLGLDYGRRRLGLALSDDSGTLASPLPAYSRSRSRQQDLAVLARLSCDRRVAQIVVGLPLNMNGSCGEMAEEARAFAQQLSNLTGLPVELVDERLTSQEAERTLIQGNVSRRRRRTLRDSLAAVLILQCYLDRRRQAFRSPGAIE
jgi:putative Holliday junction resolvase